MTGKNAKARQYAQNKRRIHKISGQYKTAYDKTAQAFEGHSGRGVLFGFGYDSGSESNFFTPYCLFLCAQKTTPPLEMYGFAWYNTFRYRHVYKHMYDYSKGCIAVTISTQKSIQGRRTGIRKIRCMCMHAGRPGKSVRPGHLHAPGLQATGLQLHSFTA